MKTFYKFIKICMIIVSASQLQAAFWELKPGAKAAGLGYAYSSVTNEADAVFYNPARIVFVEKPSLSGGYERLFYGLDQDSLHFQSFFFTMPEDDLGAFGVGNSYFMGNFYQESVYYLSYAKSLNSDFSAGISFKYLRKKIETSYSNDIALDPFFTLNGTAVSNYSFDLGLNWHKNNWTVGLVAKNLTQPDMAYQDSVSDKLPLSLSLGISKKLQYVLPWHISAELEFTNHGINKTADGFWYGAAVQSDLIEDELSFSAGFNKTMLCGGISYRGFSFSKISAGLDYAISFPFALSGESLPSGLLSHRFGFNLAFGRNPKPPSADDSRWQKNIPERFSLDFIDHNNRQNLILWVKDSSGNLNFAEAEVLADTKPPVVNKVDFVYNSPKAQLIFSGEGLDYYRLTEGENQSEWRPVKEYNPADFYKPGELNYLRYELKDKAGNTTEGSLLINGDHSVGNSQNYPLLDHIELLNPRTNRVSKSYQSDSLILRCSSNAKPTHLEYIIDDQQPVKALYQDKIPVNIQGLSADINHRITVKIYNDNYKSNSLSSVFFIDDNRPSCHFRFQGSKQKKGQLIVGSVIDPQLTVYNSIDVTDWLLCQDTLKWQNSRWSRQKPGKYSFPDGTLYPADLFLRVRDEAGNLSEWSKAQYKYDNQLPVFKQLSLSKNSLGGVYLLDNLLIRPEIAVENAFNLDILLNGNFIREYEIENDKPLIPDGIKIPEGMLEGELSFRLFNENGQSETQTVKFKTKQANSDEIGLTLKLFDLKTGLSESATDFEIGVLVLGSQNNRYLLIADNLDFKNADKVDFKHLFRYKLKGDDGLRYVFCKAVTADGKESKAAHAVIKLDRQPPSCQFRITSKNGRVDLSKVEILYDKISSDVKGYYLTEDKEDIPPFSSGKWLAKAPNFYNFTSKNNGNKTLYLYLSDRSGNIALAGSETVFLSKFLNAAEKDERDNNRNKPVVSLNITDMVSNNNKISGSDTVRIKIKADKEIAAWYLSESKIKTMPPNEGWFSEEPKTFVFKNKSNTRKQLYLLVKDINGLANDVLAVDSIRLNILTPALLNIQSADSSSLENAALPLYLNFNKLLDKNNQEELRIACVSSISGAHQVDIQIKNKSIIVNPSGSFLEGEKLTFWAYGYYRDEVGRRYYLDKRWSITLDKIKPTTKPQELTTEDNSSIVKSSLKIDRKNPAVQLFVKGIQSRQNGLTSGTEIDLDIRGDEEIKEFLIEEIK